MNLTCRKKINNGSDKLKRKISLCYKRKKKQIRVGFDLTDKIKHFQINHVFHSF